MPHSPSASARGNIPLPAATPGKRFQPPRLLEAVLSRPSLSQQLLAAEGQVVLLLAPPGSGKTLLLSEHHAAMAGGRRRTCWLTLAAEDDDPATLSRHLAQAFLLDAEATPTDGPPDAPSGIIGFIDGLEQLTRPATLDLIEHFLLSVPPDSRLLVASNRPHGMLLNKGRLRGLLRVLEPRVFRMSDTEAAALLGPGYTLPQVARLNQFVGGWAAGIRFLARAPDACQRLLSHPDENLTPPPREMADYFDHALDRMSPATLQTLMEISALERFTPGLLAALPASPCDWARIESHVRSNLFLQHTDDSRDWVAFHPAFGHHLRQRLRRLHPERHAEIRRFAASWFEAHGHTAEAVRHAVTLTETPFAARIIESSGAISVDLSDGPDVTLEYLPATQAAEYPLVFIGQIYHRIRNGRQREARNLFEQARTLTRNFTQLHVDADLPAIGSWAHMLEVVFLTVDDLPVDASHIARLEADIQMHRDREPVLATGMCTVLAAIYLDLSRHADAASLCSIGLHANTNANKVNIFVRIHQSHAALAGSGIEQAVLYIEDGMRLAHIRSRGDSYEVLTTQLVRGVLHHETNELDAARQLLKPALENLRITNGWVRLYADAFSASAAIAHHQHGLDAALAVIHEGERFARERGLPRLLTMLATTRLRELIRAGEWKAAMAQLDTSPLADLLSTESLSPYVLYQQVPALLEAAHLMLELGRPGDAIQWLDRVNKAWLEDADHRLRFDFRVHAMRAAQGLRRYNAAIEHMLAAADTARRAGLTRRALEARQHLISVLDSARRHGRNPPQRLDDWMETTLRHAKGTESGDTLHYNSLSHHHLRHAGTQQVAGNFMLSPRESEIMALIAEGCINKEIATRLGISEGTVKGHRKNVYEKLGVSSRSQAITRARELLII